MQERSAVARLVFAQLGRIDEKAVGRSEQQAHAQSHGRQPPRLEVLDRDRGVGILGAQVLAKLVAQIGGGIALRERSEEHTSELQSRLHLVCRLLLEKKKKTLKNVH